MVGRTLVAACLLTLVALSTARKEPNITMLALTAPPLNELAAGWLRVLRLFYESVIYLFI